MLLLVLTVSWLLVGGRYAVPLTIRPCTDLRPIYLLQHAIPDRLDLPRGVSVIYEQEHGIHAYSMAEHAGNLRFSASKVFKWCPFFPEEYSILATFKLSKDAPEWAEEYLLSLIPETGIDIKLGLRISKKKLTLDYSDPGLTAVKTSVSFKLDLYDGKWHTLVLGIAGNVAVLRVDCDQARTKPFPRSFPSFLDTTADNLHIGNRKIAGGQFTGLMKQLLLLPGADASQLACPDSVDYAPSLSSSKSEQATESEKHPTAVVQTTFDTSCTWKDTGKMWYDIYTRRLLVCQSGVWYAILSNDQTNGVVRSSARMDYIMEHSRLQMTAPAIDVEIFEISGEGKFVVFANYNRSLSAKQPSTVYKWTGEELVPYQNLTTIAAEGWTHFSVDGSFYLALANMGTEAGKDSLVTIYKWHKSKDKFLVHQELPANAARDVEYFEIDGSHYIAVANHRKGDNLATESQVLRWNAGTKRFDPFQSIPTIGAMDWTHFTISGYHFLAVANAFNGHSTRVDSVIYVWHSNSFVVFQTIETTSACDWEYFEVDGQSFLAVANAFNYGPQNPSKKDPYTVDSVIYRLNKSKRYFEKFQIIRTHSIIDWEFFKVGAESYLIASNTLRDLKSFEDEPRAQTVIYRWQGVEKFVPAHRLNLQQPSADWEALYDGGQVYLVSANSRDQQTELYKVQLE